MRVVLCGSHSTGKTTLLPHFPELKIIPEFARELFKKGYPLNQKTTQEGQTLIFNKSLEALLTEDNFIADRSLIDVYAYTINSENYIETWTKFYMHNNILRHFHKYDKVIYVPIVPEVDLAMDGVRDADQEYRKKIDTDIQYYLRNFKVPYYTLQSVSIEDRVAEVKRIIYG